MTLARALTIAGSDSGGGAGIQADLKTFTALGVFGTTALTAVTAQNTQGVTGVYPLTPAQVGAQLDAVLSDIGTDAAKTGMLFDVPIITMVAEKIRQYGVKNLVLDPVMFARSGHALLLPEARSALQRLLLPLAAVVTPNVLEAEALTGRPIRSKSDLAVAAYTLVEMGARAAVVKGGYLAGEPADDAFCAGGNVEWLQADRVQTSSTHGTGCTFSAAITAGLAKGMGLRDAVLQAKAYITLAIQTAPGLGQGHGPTNHLTWIEQGRTTTARHAGDPSDPSRAI